MGYEVFAYHKRFLLVLSILYFITFNILMYLGEVRVDVYISLYILEFFILYAIFSPVGVRADKALRILSYIYFIIFIIIVTYRVLEILGIKLVLG